MAETRIMVVEDEANVAAHLRQVLQQMGYNVVRLIATGEDAVEQAGDLHPDVILMDIRLRGQMTGLEAATQISARWDVPVIYLTTHTEEAVLQQAQLTEPYGYLSMPVRDKELQAGIEMALYKHRTDRRLKHLAEVLRAVRNVNQLMAREHNQQHLLAEACRILVQTRGYGLVWIGQKEANVPRLTPVARAGQGQAGVEVMVAAGEEGQASRLPWVEAVHTRQQVVCQDLAMEPGDTLCREMALAHGLASTCVTPMMYAERLFGILCVHADKPNAFDEEELVLLDELAADLALALSNIEAEAQHKQAEEALKAYATRLAILNELGRQITATLDLDSVLHRAVELVQQRFGYHHVALYIASERELVMRARAGDFTHLFPPDHRLKLNQGMVGWVFNHGQILLANDVCAEARFFNPYPQVIPTASELSVPLCIGDKTLGVLDLQSAALNSFSEDDVKVMETLGHQIAVAIENARLYEAVQHELTERRQAETKMRQRNRELSLLNQVMATAAANPEAILEITCRELAAAFDVPQVNVALLNEKKTRATVVAGYTAINSTQHQSPEPLATLGQVIVVRHNPALHFLLSQQKPLAVGDDDDPHLASLRGLLCQGDMASALVSPLIHQGRVLGLLCLDDTRSRRFSLEEINVVESVAGQIAAALTRAKAARVQQRLSTAIEQSAEAVIITDVRGYIVYVNPAFERLSGYSAAEAIGESTRILKSGRHDLAFYQNLWSTITAGQVWVGRIVNKKKDGALYTEDVTISPVKDESGQIVNYVAVNRDITRELQLEEQYHQAQKMEAIGQLTAGIAHDFNNLLTAINGFTELAQVRLEPDHPLQKSLERILHSGQRAASLVSQLMAFSRKQVLEPEVLNLNTVVADMEKMLRRIIGEHITLKTILAPDLWSVKVDPSQMEQVIVNLAVNARDAMPDGGYLTLETANVTLGQEYLAHHLDVPPGEYVQLAVSDSGIGMTGEVKARIFEPFFTTKAEGKGTGLGLATVFGVVKQSSGYIWVHSEPGHGTTFEIYLPRIQAVAAPSARSEQFRNLPTGHETVLVVEDAPGVREMTIAVLRQLGYTVLEAGDGPAAIHLAQQYQEPINLLLTDVVLPSLNGKVLATQLAQLHPGLKQLFMSGYTDEAIVHHGFLEPGTAFLQKPFTTAKLARKVREVLDGK